MLSDVKSFITQEQRKISQKSKAKNNLNEKKKRSADNNIKLSQLPNKGLKEAITKMLSAIRKYGKSQLEQVENLEILNKEIEAIEKNKMETVVMKTTLAKMKNSSNGLNSRMEGRK